MVLIGVPRELGKSVRVGEHPSYVGREGPFHEAAPFCRGGAAGERGHESSLALIHRLECVGSGQAPSGLPSLTDRRRRREVRSDGERWLWHGLRPCHRAGPKVSHPSQEETFGRQLWHGRET